MIKIDLNCDLGESFGNYKLGLDEEIIPNVTSINVACGWHGGDPIIMENTVKMAKKYNVGVGAHPGFLDLMGFGRRNISITPKELKAYVKYQIGALLAFTLGEGIKIEHVKPHGAMYNMAAKDKKLARAIAEAIYELDRDIILLGLYNSELINEAKKMGLKAANEVFADRAYNDDGTLVSRSVENSVLHDSEVIIKRTLRMVKDNVVTSINGKDIFIEPHSICVHGDNPNAINLVKELRKAFKEENIEVTSLSNIGL